MSISKVIIERWTEEEIARSPFPETARRIGGVLKVWRFHDVNAPEEREEYAKMQQMRQQFYDSLASAKVTYRCPVYENRWSRFKKELYELVHK